MRGRWRSLALICVLGSGFHLTQFKIRNLLAQMMGLDFSVGAISQAHGKVAQALAAPVAEAVRSLAIDAPVVHMDETRYPREGSANWVWGAVQPKLAVFCVLPSRARYVAQDLLGQSPKGVLVTDRYAVYDFVGAEQRQVCWAHLLRDFTRIAERQGVARTVGRRLLGLGLLMFRWRHRGMTSAEQFEPLSRRLRRALQAGVAQTGCRRTANTCANLLKLWPALWGFVSHPGVEPTNNAAEQALRTIVLKRKISGPTRSKRGGLWSPLRGFARATDRYCALLAAADEPRRGDLDGRGNLSDQALVDWISFVLEVCQDQVDFMAGLLRLGGMERRIAACLAYEEQTLRSGIRLAALRPQHCLFVTGSTLERGEFKTLLGLGDRTAGTVLKALLARRLLASDSPQGPVRFGLPLHALRFYFPALWPEAEADDGEPT